MPRNVTIAAVQLPEWTEGETAHARKAFHVDALEHWLGEAGRAHADLVCLGEMCTGGEEIEDAYSGPTTTMARQMAAHYEMDIVLPLCATVDGVLRNTALLIDNTGRIVGHYNKVHPTRRELGDGIVPGDDFSVFQFDFGCVGICICHDLSFPESTRVLALRGAELIVWPSWWSGWGEELCYAVIKSRAIDNGVWLVHAGFGIEQHKAWRPGMVLGRSGVIAPDGLILSNAGRYVGMSIATVDLDQTRLAHAFSWPADGDFWTSVLADRRPDAYGPLVDPAYVIPAVPPEQRTERSTRQNSVGAIVAGAQ